MERELQQSPIEGHICPLELLKHELLGYLGSHGARITYPHQLNHIGHIKMHVEWLHDFALFQVFKLLAI